jgi:hypothetical protein
MITITTKVSYEFDYKHNLNNNFNTGQNLIKPAELIHFCKQGFEIFCNRLVYPIESLKDRLTVKNAKVSDIITIKMGGLTTVSIVITMFSYILICT